MSRRTRGPRTLAGAAQPGGSFVVQKDGRLQPNLDDEAMAARAGKPRKAEPAPDPNDEVTP